MTKSSTWLRALAGTFALFAVGHTLGTLAPRASRGPQQAIVLDAMRSFRFPVMGFTRSYWDFYLGFALILSIHLALLAVIAWQTAAISRHDAQRALPLACTLLASCVGTLVISCRFFFGAPIAVAAAGVLCAVASVRALAAERRKSVVPSIIP